MSGTPLVYGDVNLFTVHILMIAFSGKLRRNIIGSMGENNVLQSMKIGSFITEIYYCLREVVISTLVVKFSVLIRV